MKSNIVVPVIHMNGSSRESLQEQYRKAAIAITDALEALYEAAPHGRDCQNDGATCLRYYPLGDDAYSRARTQHEDRIAKLENVRQELTVIYESIA